MKENLLLTKSQTMFLFAAFVVVYISGVFIPLMENDSAQHATMAMRMALTGDFLHIYKGENPYLDKPQLHFWLAAISMKLFGIHHIAYRIPALFCLALGAFSTKKLADLLYENVNLGNVAALIFLSAQTIILSAHDVRTDAVLTGFVIFSIWQFVKFIKTQNLLSAAMAGLGMALAFSAKGQMAVVIIGLCIFSYLLYSREWKRFFNVKILVAALCFAVGILPVLYAYYHQFGGEGIQFILFNQSLNRLNAKGFEETSPDYFFFFHTLLWAFLPFSLAFYTGVFDKSAWFIKNKFKKISGVEFLTLGGFWMVMLLFSASKFKLPHYLNGLIPVVSVFTAAYLFEIFVKRKTKTIKILWIIQLIIIFSTVGLMILLILNFTGIENPLMYVVFAFLFAFLLYSFFDKENLVKKYVWASLLFAVVINLFLNTQFYPVLTQFQGDLQLAKFANENHLDRSKFRMLKNYEAWDFDFYTRQNTPRVSPEELKSGDILLIQEEDLKQFSKPYKVVAVAKNYHITRLSIAFLNKYTRERKLDKNFLVQILE